MTFSSLSTVRCDQCNAVEMVDESSEEMLGRGWLSLSYGPEDEDSVDFCGLLCLHLWADSDDARERLQDVADRIEGD